MAFTLKELREYVDSSFEDAHSSENTTWLAALSPIASQLHIIEGAKTLELQMTGCQQLSNSILVVQMLNTYQSNAQKLNDLRVEIGQFAFMGRDS
jgi:hypothetical protein